MHDYVIMNKVVQIFRSYFLGYLFVGSLLIFPFLERSVILFLDFCSSFGWILSEPQVRYGGGDSYLDFLAIWIFLLLGFLIYKSSRNFNLKPFLSFFLGVIMISYGFVKFGNQQFYIFPDEALKLPVGDLSPMMLLWILLSKTTYYTGSIGFLQILSGLFLIIPRTREFGNIIAAILLMNIVLMNLFIDIPVKLFSIHLLISTFFIQEKWIVILHHLFHFKSSQL